MVLLATTSKTPCRSTGQVPAKAGIKEHNRLLPKECLCSEKLYPNEMLRDQGKLEDVAVPVNPSFLPMAQARGFQKGKSGESNESLHAFAASEFICTLLTEDRSESGSTFTLKDKSESMHMYTSPKQYKPRCT